MLTNRKSLISLVIIAILSFMVIGCGEYDLNSISVTGVSIVQGNQNLTKDDTVQLTATVTPSDATKKSVTWASSNASVATVSNTGLVTALVPGGTTITVTTTNGGKHDAIEVAVHEGAAGP